MKQPCSAVPALVVLLACGGSSSPTNKPLVHDTTGDDEATPVEVDETEPPVDPSDDPRVGRFARFDLRTTDARAASQFHSKLFGWTIGADGKMRNGDSVIGTMGALDTSVDLKPGWIAYISVADVDDVVRDVVANGGKVVASATETNGSREAIVRGPTGGAFGLRQLNQASDSRELGESDGDVYWAQLWTSNLAAALSFYQVVGEYTSSEYRFGKVRYQILKASNGSPVAAFVNTPPGQRNRWLPFVRVANVDATVSAAKKLGAKTVTAPREVAGIGRIASLTTPSGGVIGVIAPAATDE